MHVHERLVPEAKNVEERLARKVKQRILVQVREEHTGLQRVHVPVQPGTQAINTMPRGVHIYTAAACGGGAGLGWVVREKA